MTDKEYAKRILETAVDIWVVTPYVPLSGYENPCAVYLSEEAARTDYPNTRNYRVDGPFKLRGLPGDFPRLWKAAIFGGS